MTPCFPPTTLNHINIAMKNFIGSYRQPSSRTTGTNAKSAIMKSYSLTNTLARRICLHNIQAIFETKDEQLPHLVANPRLKFHQLELDGHIAYYTEFNSTI